MFGRFVVLEDTTPMDVTPRECQGGNGGNRRVLNFMSSSSISTAALVASPIDFYLNLYLATGMARFQGNFEFFIIHHGRALT